MEIIRDGLQNIKDFGLYGVVQRGVIRMYVDKIMPDKDRNKQK